MSTRHFLDPINPSRGELPSDADPIQTGTVVMGSGDVHHIPAPGSLAEQVIGSRIPLTTARTSGAAATRDAQAYDSFGAAPEGPRESTHIGIEQ